MTEYEQILLKERVKIILKAYSYGITYERTIKEKIKSLFYASYGNNI